MRKHHTLRIDRLGAVRDAVRSIVLTSASFFCPRHSTLRISTTHTDSPSHHPFIPSSPYPLISEFPQSSEEFVRLDVRRIREWR